MFQLAGGEGVSVMHPRWTPDNQLVYISDVTNWWNLYKVHNGNALDRRIRTSHVITHIMKCYLNYIMVHIACIKTLWLRD